MVGAPGPSISEGVVRWHFSAIKLGGVRNLAGVTVAILGVVVFVGTIVGRSVHPQMAVG